jgi:hypothetical protein
MKEPITTTENHQPEAARWSDTDALEDLAQFMNFPGEVSGADLVDRVELLLEATGRRVLDDPDGDYDSVCEHDQ